MKRENAQPRRHVIFNNDGGSQRDFYRIPLSWEKIAEANVGVFRDTPMKTLFWGLGNGHVFHHETEFGDFFGQDLESYETMVTWARHEHFKRLIQEGHDLFQGVVEEGHKIGLEVFASFRMNDFHDSREENALGPFKKKHPEFLLGDSVDVYEMGMPHKYSVRTCMNYAIPEVREFRMNLMRETVEKYDVDGIEMDWSRAPWAFKPGEERQNLGLMNEFVRETRRILDQKAKKLGRKLYLATAAPPTFRKCLEIGLDVSAWLDEGLLDILAVGHFSSQGHPFNLLFEEIREATRNAGCQLFARINATKEFVEQPEILRAAASTYYMGGVDGIYLFNFHNHPCQGRLNEIHDPDALERLNKRYIVPKRSQQHPSPWAQPHLKFTGSANGLPPPLSIHSTRRPGVATEPLPLVLIQTNADVGETLEFQIADDLDGAVRDGVLGEAKLKLSLVNYHPDTDEVVFQLNDRPICNYELIDAIGRNECVFEFSLEGSWINRGTNTLKAILKRMNPLVTGKMVLADVELSITYSG